MVWISKRALSPSADVFMDIGTVGASEKEDDMKKALFTVVVVLLTALPAFAGNTVKFPFGTGKRGMSENLLSDCLLVGKRVADGYIAVVSVGKDRYILVCQQGVWQNIKNLGSGGCQQREPMWRQ